MAITGAFDSPVSIRQSVSNAHKAGLGRLCLNTKRQVEVEVQTCEEIFVLYVLLST